MSTTTPTPTPHSLATPAFLAAVRMANLSHNLAQRPAPPDEAEWQVLRRRMRENHEMWDAGEAAVRGMVAATVPTGEGQ